MGRVEVIPLPGIPWVGPGDDIPAMIMKSASRNEVGLTDGDVVVIKQKIVSKAEGRLVRLKDVRPGRRARALAKSMDKDPRIVQLILRESRRIVRAGYGVIVTETKHGFVCANAGIDSSNVPPGQVLLLPVDPDRSARTIRRALERSAKCRLAVIVSDTFGRPWRLGQTDVAIGCSGISPMVSYKGRKDAYGKALKVTMPAVVDELAGAAELVIGKLSKVPAAIVRGAKYRRGNEGVASLVLEREKDLFNWTR